jgi:hypothetical protein
MRQNIFPACFTRNLTIEYKRVNKLPTFKISTKQLEILLGRKKGLKKTVREILLPGKISHEAMRKCGNKDFS